VERCSDLRVESRGEVAQAVESFTLPRSQASMLEISALDRGSIRVLGAAQADYAVEVCKIAAAESRGAAEQLVRGIAINRSAGRLSASGPNTSDGEWMTYFIVHAPKDAPVDLETKNGPISVTGMEAMVKVRATNGPIALRDCTGRVEANTANGPIAFTGGGGDVHLTAHNGPIAVKVSGDLWNGNQLDAHTDNGPVSLDIPDNFRSGVRVETSGHSPISCRAGACNSAMTDSSGNQRVMQMNGSQDTIRVSTNNGPVSVGGGNDKMHRVI